MPLAPFVRSDAGVHSTLDRAALLAFYDPIDQPSIIGSPVDVATWEALRERHNIVDPNGIACDLFVWGTGEAPDQRLTRVGGVPWLPKEVPWPMVDDVIPSFLCQFDFRDSRDLVGDLPGDLLLVFVAEQDAILFGDSSLMRFVWVSASEAEVIESSDVPTPTHPFDFVRAWGVRHRTMDVPACWDRAYDESKSRPEGNRLWQLPVLWGTKIGGVPYDSQSNHDSAPEGYLCQLVSITPRRKAVWPWVDSEPPVTDGANRSERQRHSLVIGDLGEVTFYLRKDGVIDVDSACG